MSEFLSRAMAQILQAAADRPDADPSPWARADGRPSSGGLDASGLEPLLQRLRQAGLGQQVDSWIGTGPNQPVAPEQLQHALGADRMGGIARQLGVEGGLLGSILAMALPRVIDALTPRGNTREGPEGGLGGVLGSILGGGQAPPPRPGAGSPPAPHGAELGLPDTGGLGDDLAGMLGRALGRR